MQSPAAEAGTGIDGVDLPSLSLEPAYQGNSNHNHIFAFGAGSTWGVSGSNGRADSWGVTAPAGGNAASFLNLSSEKTWNGLSSFGGSLGNSAFNGDNPSSTGD